MSSARLPASLSEEERSDYVTLVASMAAADQLVTQEEIERLEGMCKGLKLGRGGMGLARASAILPDPEELNAIVERMKTSITRFAVLLDATLLMLADGEVSAAEQNELDRLAGRLCVSPEQLAVIGRFGNTVHAILQGDALDEPEALGRNLARQLDQTRVPIGALQLGGTVLGSDAAGVQDRLERLREGIGASRLGVANSMGIGSFYGVRWLNGLA